MSEVPDNLKCQRRLVLYLMGSLVLGLFGLIMVQVMHQKMPWQLADAVESATRDRFSQRFDQDDYRTVVAEVLQRGETDRTIARSISISAFMLLAGLGLREARRLRV